MSCESSVIHCQFIRDCVQHFQPRSVAFVWFLHLLQTPPRMGSVKTLAVLGCGGPSAVTPRTSTTSVVLTRMNDRNLTDFPIYFRVEDFTDFSASGMLFCCFSRSICCCSCPALIAAAPRLSFRRSVMRRNSASAPHRESMADARSVARAL